ncbi:hypothetical protein LV779_34620 [Streptomyces thinghirensis]|nr:hypothetical protein [Streptomyces thinghirensis]
MRDWPAGTGPRRAAQSSIGLGGTNAHAVFEEYVRTADAPARADGARAPQLVPLSARTRDDLVRAAAALRRHLTGPRAAALRLDDVAHTLRTGRVAMACRVAFVVRDLERLAAELDAFVRDPDGDDTARRFTGPAASPTESAARKHTERLARALADGKPKKAAKAWARGADADWSRLTGQRPARRVSLPGYAFAPVAHPYPARAPHARAAALRPDETPGTPLAHPLLHENVSRFDDQRYRSAFTGDEFVLRDHVVDGKLLPAVAGLEMACTAVRRALPEAAGRRIIVTSVTWARPVVVDDGGRRVEFTLTRDDTSPTGPLAFALLTDGDQVVRPGPRHHRGGRAAAPRRPRRPARPAAPHAPRGRGRVRAHRPRGCRLRRGLPPRARAAPGRARRAPRGARRTAAARAPARHGGRLRPPPELPRRRRARLARPGPRLRLRHGRAGCGRHHAGALRPRPARRARAVRRDDVRLGAPGGAACHGRGARPRHRPRRPGRPGLRHAARPRLPRPDRPPAAGEPARPGAARASELRTLLPVWEPRHPAEAPRPGRPSARRGARPRRRPQAVRQNWPRSTPATSASTCPTARPSTTSPH